MFRWFECFHGGMRTIIAATVLVAVALSGGCSTVDEPDSLVDEAGYHVRDNAVYYLNPFPGKAFEIDDADAATFDIIDRTYARDSGQVYINGYPLPGAQPGSFELLERPGFARDSRRVYQHDQPISTDPGHFELLPGGLSKDSSRVYASDGAVLSHDPAEFEIVSDEDDYLFARDGGSVYVNNRPIRGASPSTFEVLSGGYSRDAEHAFYFDRQIADADVASFRVIEGPYAVDSQRVYWMGEVIAGADPASFEVLNANFECSADATHAFYRQTTIPGARPATFPPDSEVVGCSPASISFAD